ncbi:prostaglandin reductase 3 [Parasteatoda tepidariorum]|uniref:prostaglandin reductase 3 n=1 Tax=Parasteatoda tepidariorum TaxID=114398 RepID=UPI00077FAABB|nr:prostaglandin reductase 3 [Parasteatoda tepidariorum]XP_015930670.1 prostaglandin reductase 3 [Parasteatoda tepidariorum]XP_015930673.1 prostaglandin reductase 3 [Parasteatoda tepidariorum]
MSSKPKTHRRMMVQKLTTNFREAVVIEEVAICCPSKGEVCVKNKYVGINATDINITKGRYFTDGKLPFAIGFEGVGEIVEIGEGVENVKVGQSVAYMSGNLNAYAEYACVSAKELFPLPETKPEYVVLCVSGMTSTIGMDKSARIMAGETVLITAAAGGAGHIAVQWAKAADCHVIGTCSSKEKEKLLKELGCDRVINYKTEDLDEVLTKEYKDGVNVIWETIGGKIFETCLKHLSKKGRLIVVGGITGYKNDSSEGLPKVDLSNLPSQLLFNSSAIQGFLVLHYADCFATYFKYMMENVQSGKLRAIVDNGATTTGEEFVGLEGVYKGVEHLHSGKSIGKVVVRIS